MSIDVSRHYVAAFCHILIMNNAYLLPFRVYFVFFLVINWVKWFDIDKMSMLILISFFVNFSFDRKYFLTVKGVGCSQYLKASPSRWNIIDAQKRDFLSYGILIWNYFCLTWPFFNSLTFLDLNLNWNSLHKRGGGNSFVTKWFVFL